MKKIINFIKRDFNSVSEALTMLFGMELPKGVLILYYIIVGLLALVLSPFIAIWYYWYMRKINKFFKELDEA